MVNVVSQLLWQYWKNVEWHLQICNSYFYEGSEMWPMDLLFDVTAHLSVRIRYMLEDTSRKHAYIILTPLNPTFI